MLDEPRKPKPKPSPSPSPSPELSDEEYRKTVLNALRKNQTQVSVAKKGGRDVVLPGRGGSDEWLERDTIEMPGDSTSPGKAIRTMPTPSPSPLASPGADATPDYAKMPMSDLKALMAKDPEAVRAYMKRLGSGER